MNALELEARLADAHAGVQAQRIIVPNASAFADESALYRRYRAKPKMLSELTFEFTKDKTFVHQYRELYERECRVAYHIPGFREAEDKYNEKGHILIVRRGNFCIGGGRLSIRTPRKRDSLPMEIDGFTLTDHLPELEQKQMSYGEISRLALLPEFRTGETTMMMWRHFYRKCVALNVDIMFAAAPLSNVRSYRINSQAIGLKQNKIYTHINIPPYPAQEYVKDYLISTVIDKALLAQPDWSNMQVSQEELAAEEA